MSKTKESRALKKLNKMVYGKERLIGFDATFDKLLRNITKVELSNIATTRISPDHYSIRRKAIELVDDKTVLERIASNNVTPTYVIGYNDESFRQQACGRLGHMIERCICKRCGALFHESKNCECIRCGQKTHDFIWLNENSVSEEIREKIRLERQRYAPSSTSTSIKRCKVCGETLWSVFWED